MKTWQKVSSLWDCFGAKLSYDSGVRPRSAEPGLVLRAGGPGMADASPDDVLLEQAWKSGQPLPTPKGIFLPKKGASLLSMSFSQRLAQTSEVHLSLALRVVTQNNRECELKQSFVLTKTMSKKGLQATRG